MLLKIQAVRASTHIYLCLCSGSRFATSTL